MAELAADDPGQRGRTTIDDRVVAHIATHAAAEVDGVTRVGSGLDKVVGRQYPKAEGQVAGTHARVSVEIAVAWPQPLSVVAGRVRDTVSARLHEMSGLEIDAVDVSVARVMLPQQQAPRRVQ